MDPIAPTASTPVSSPAALSAKPFYTSIILGIVGSLALVGVIVFFAFPTFVKEFLGATQSQRYSNDRYGFSFQYPTYLKLESIDEDETRLTFKDLTAKDYPDSAFDFVEVALFDGDARAYGYAALYSDIVEPGTTQDLKFVPVTLGGNAGYKITKNEEILPAHYVVKNGNYIYDFYASYGAMETSGMLETIRFYEAATSTTWRTYTNEHFGIKLSFPPDWTWADDGQYTGAEVLEKYGNIAFTSTSTTIKRAYNYETPADITVAIVDLSHVPAKRVVWGWKEYNGKKFDIVSDTPGCFTFIYSIPTHVPYASLHTYEFGTCEESMLEVLEHMIETTDFPKVPEMKLVTYHHNQSGLEVLIPEEWRVEEGQGEDAKPYTRFSIIPGSEYANIIFAEGQAPQEGPYLKKKDSVTIGSNKFSVYEDTLRDEYLYTLAKNNKLYLFRTGNYVGYEQRLKEMLATLAFIK